MLRSEGEHFIEHSNVSIIIIIIATKTVSIVHGIQIQIQMIKVSYIINYHDSRFNSS